MNRKELVTWWVMRPAKWYEFYFPQSGCIGGLILGFIFCSGLLILSQFIAMVR